MVPGAFVRVKFPTREKPRQPGLLHIGYVLGGTATEVMVACTTSQPWRQSVVTAIQRELHGAERT